MKKVVKLSVSVLATVILSLACGHGTAAMNRAAAVSVFSPNNSTLPMYTSTVSGMTGFNSASKAVSNVSNSSPLAMNSSSMAGLVNNSCNSSSQTVQAKHYDNPGSNSSPTAQANNSGKSGSGSGKVARSENSGKASGTPATTKRSGNTGGGSTTAGKKIGNSDGSTDINVPVIAGSDTHKAEAAYDMDAIKRELIAYGESKGLHYNPNLGLQNSGYDAPTDVLQDTLNKTEFIQQEKDGIDWLIKSRKIAGADFNPYFERKSNRTNDYLVYELYG